MNIIERSFSPIFGKPCWGIVYDRQTNLAMNFGRPNLRVREPYTTKSKSKFIRTHAARRTVTIRGQWWLWIFCAYWRVYKNDQFVGGYSSSFRKGEKAVHVIEGQKLLRVSANAKTGATRFVFDLGGVLEVQRLRHYESDHDLWLLYKPNGYVLSVHGNGTYDHGPGSGIDKRKGVKNAAL